MRDPVYRAAKYSTIAWLVALGIVVSGDSCAGMLRAIIESHGAAASALVLVALWAMLFVACYLDEREIARKEEP